MKELLERLGFRKADEMGRSIQLKSIRLAWIYTVIFLFVWNLYESCAAKRLDSTVNLIPSFLLISQNFMLIGSQLFLRRRMTGDDEEKKDFFGAVILIVSAIITIIVVLGALTRLIVS